MRGGSSTHDPIAKLVNVSDCKSEGAGSIPAGISKLNNMIHLHDSRDGQYYFTVAAKNGRVLVTSETYKTRRAMMNGAKSLISIMDINQTGKIKFKDHTK